MTHVTHLDTVDGVRDTLIDALDHMNPDQFIKISIDDSQDNSKLALVDHDGYVWLVTVEPGVIQAGTGDPTDA